MYKAKKVGWWSLYAPKKAVESPLEALVIEPAKPKSPVTQIEYLKMYAAMLPQDRQQSGLSSRP